MRNALPLSVVPSALNAVAAARAVEAEVFGRAAAVDAAGAYPADDIAALADGGLLHAPLPARLGGTGLASDAATLRDVLVVIGRASLTVGRLYEGHANAVLLVEHYGRAPAMAIVAEEIEAGRPSGVWNAERGGGLAAHRMADGWRLAVRKVHCSGAGSVVRPIVTARPVGEDAPIMLLPDLTTAGVTVDLSVWRAAGMRGTATATVDFDGVFVPDAAVVGEVGDYYRSPLFSGGAWRVLAVQLGGLERILMLHAERLRGSGRDADPVFRARFAQAAAGCELARLSVAEAARRAAVPGAPADAVDAYVDLARGGFEELALAGIAAARRNVGLGSFIAPDPLDRVLRDLETYLRQPFLDASRDHAATWLLPRGGRFDA